MGTERRKHERIPAEYPVRVRVWSGDEVREGTSWNMSPDGLLVKVEDPPPPGATILVELDLEPIGRTFCAEAEVIWALARMPGPASSAGMGVRFMEMTDQARSLLDLAFRKHESRQGD